MEIQRIGDIWKAKYGTKIYKLSLSTGCTCPNRDGYKSVGGCTFCSESGSGDFAISSEESMDFRIEKAKELVARKGATKYIAYFQSFTNTYAPVERIEPLFLRAALHPEIVELSIATRCDCLDDSIIEMLDKLNRIKPVTVELGLQSSHNETLKRCNCCYTVSEFDSAVKKLKSAGLRVIAHVIIGFPWESDDDMVESARHVAETGADGIKLQLLHVLKGTKMGNDYLSNPFETMSLEHYAEVLGRCLNALPARMEIHRLTGDGAKKDLIAPLWSADKRKTMNYINNYIRNLSDNRPY